MSWTLGRASFTNNPSSMQFDGDRLRIDFNILPSTLAEAKVLRQQVLGLAGNDDEPVIPVTFSADSDIDGFYAVRGASVEPASFYTATSPLMRASVNLERVVGGYAAPEIETIVASQVRTNGVGITDTEPEGVTGWRIKELPAYGAPTGSASLITRVSADGDLFVYSDDAPVGPETSVTTVPPSRFYDAGAMIEVSDGSNWHKLVGRQLPGNYAGLWRISNGLVRFTASVTNVGDLKIECYDTSAWVAMETELRYGQDSSGTFSQPNSEGGFATGYDQDNSTVEWVQPTIVRNDRDTVIVQFHRSAGYTQTFTLHAADVFCEFRSTVASGHVHAIQSRSAWTSSGLGATSPFAYDPGIQSTSNDGNGNKLLLLYADDGSWTKYSGTYQGIYVGAGRTTAAFGIGAVIDGSSATTGNTGLEAAEQYCAAKSWRTRVVAG